MAKLLFFSDLHLHNFPAFSHTDQDTGLNSRLMDQIACLAQVKETCEKYDVDALILCGDVFHSRTKIDVDVLWCAVETLSQLAKVVPEFYILVGNHDQSTKDGTIHSLDCFRHFANVISEPKKLTVAGEINTYFHPFTTDYQAFKAYCDAIPFSSTDQLFVGHQGVSEGLVGAYEVPIKADIPLAWLPHDRCKFVFLGHYHKHQWLNKNTAYIGSPLQLDFGERTEDKGFLLLDTDEWTVKQIPSNAPKFRLFNTPEAFEKAMKLGDVDTERDFVRVHGQASQIRKIQDSYPKVQVVQEAVPYEHPSRVDPKMTASDKDLLAAYIENTQSALDRDRLLRMGLDLLGAD